VKRSKGSPVGINQALNGVLSEAGLSHLLHEEKLRKNWTALLGPRASAMASLDSLRGWVLKVKVDSATWRNELNFQRETLRSRANEILGAELVRDVILV
jgi:predicted nucleic acid-binding Zn ribbon protein